MVANKENVKKHVEDAIKDIDLDKNSYSLTLTTSKGPIRLEFFADKAPNHVKNMVALAQIGFYNDLIFHRIIDGFMIQGGCPLGQGTGGPGYNIDAEFNDTTHEPGVLSMARAMDPNSAGSQFFICLAAHGHLDGQYTAFGKAADEESMATVRAIGGVPTGAQDRPNEDVVITAVDVQVTPL